MQTSVKTVLHTTSKTKLDYYMKKSTSEYEHDAGRKEYIWTVYMCNVFRLMINSCKIMQGSKSHAITQTIHTNRVGLFCDAGYCIVNIGICLESVQSALDIRLDEFYLLLFKFS